MRAVPGTLAARPRLWAVPALLLGLAGWLDLRAGIGATWTAPAVPAAAEARCAGGGRVACRAYGPILRRDPLLNEKMQRWIGQQLRLMRRQDGAREQDTADAVVARKAAYLARLGLGDKAKQMQQQASTKKPAWHLAHMQAGDVFKGTFEHPDIQRGDKVDLTLTVVSPSEATWASIKAQFEGEAAIEQDFPIPFEKGEKQDLAMAAYVFSKFNPRWRDFKEPVPRAEELEHLSLAGLRMFFQQVADVEGFPEEQDFLEEVADPAKGMSKEEFLAYVGDEDAAYLAGAFPNIFTGRRLRISDEDLVLDGDFQPEAPGVICGYASLSGRGGGSFILELSRG